MFNNIVFSLQSLFLFQSMMRVLISLLSLKKIAIYVNKYAEKRMMMPVRSLSLLASLKLAEDP